MRIRTGSDSRPSAGLSVAGVGNLRGGEMPSFPASVASWECLVGPCVILDVGLDACFLVQSLRATLGP